MQKIRNFSNKASLLLALVFLGCLILANNSLAGCSGDGSGGTICVTDYLVCAGECVSANGTPTPVPPTTNLCNVGTASAVSGTGPYTWTCTGTNGGSTASCSACHLTYSNYVCSRAPSIDCSILSNCGLSGTNTASCLALNSCTGTTDSITPSTTCGTGCVSTSYACGACTVESGGWKEVAP